MNIRLNKKGTGLVSVALGSLLGVSALYYLGQAVTGANRTCRAFRDTVIANGYAADLLELFLSQSPGHLKQYLSKNPMDPEHGVAYPLCTVVNKLNENRAPNEPAIFNPDPLADLEETPLTAAQRSYRVEVVDIANPTELTSRRDLCDPPRSAASVQLQPNERYLVTVEVSWRTVKGERKAAQMSGLVGGGLP